MNDQRRQQVIQSDGTRAEQLPLFELSSPGRGQRSPLVPPPISPFPGPLTGESSLALALSWFAEEMTRKDYALHTQINYVKGVTRLMRYLGRDTRLRDILPGDLERFLAWVERQPRAPKTKELTVTAVRTFFTLLTDAGVLQSNPAADVYPAKAHSPLPQALFDAQADRLRRTAAEMATRTEEPDAMPALLLSLLLDLGLRLGEVERLEIEDLDLSNPLRPVVHVRYEERRHRAKQRSLVGPPDLTTLLHLYLEHHPPGEAERRLFPCSRRRLQQVVEDLGKAAGLRRRLTPNTLRWTFALTQWKEGVPEETLRARLGLSKLGWEDTREKLQALARRPV